MIKRGSFIRATFLFLLAALLFTGCGKKKQLDVSSRSGSSLLISTKESGSENTVETSIVSELSSQCVSSAIKSLNSSNGSGFTAASSYSKVVSDPFAASLKSERQRVQESLNNAIVKRYKPEDALDSFGDLTRIANVMRRAKRGEKITVGILGDSISAGASASPGKGYGDLVKDWWVRVFGASAVNFVNAAIGSNTEVNVAHRMEDHLLSAKPDIVFNGCWKLHDPLNENRNACESIIKRMLDQNIAVVCITLSNKNTAEKDVAEMKTLSSYYKVPHVSFYNALKKSGISWETIGADDLHPNTNGHSLIAASVNTLLTETAEKLNSLGSSPAALPSVPMNADGWRYTGAALWNRDHPGNLKVESAGSAVNAEWVSGKFTFNGWKLGAEPMTVTLPKISTLHLLTLYQIDGGKIYITVIGQSGKVICNNVAVSTFASSPNSYSWPSNILAAGINEPVSVSVHSDSSAVVLGFMITP